MANQIVEIFDSYVIKRYDIDNPNKGVFSCMTQKDKFLNEIEIYKMLENTDVTPKLLEVGRDFLRIEKFDTTLGNIMESGKYSKAYIKLIMDKYVKPKCRILDMMGIDHDDQNLDNIVCNYQLDKLAIIDFEYSDLDEFNINNYDYFIDFLNKQ